MIGELKSYPAMKDSGVEWLGEVPEHWHVRKLRHLLTRRTERNRPDLPLLSVVRDKGVIVRDLTDQDGNHNFIPDDLSNYKVVRAGQFVMNKMKAWQGSFGVSGHDGIVSPAYFVFDLSGTEGGFFHRAIRSRAYVPQFTRASDGVRIGQWDLAESRMREIHFVLPPLPEQAAIVRLLDYADRRIRRYMRAKQKLIKLLEEQKQAIIQRAVTRGLDPDVPLKDSGVEWLGKVPEHWKVYAFSRLAVERADYRGATPRKTDRGVFLVTARNVRKGWIDYETSKEYVAEEEYSTIMRRGLPRVGDLLLTTEAPLGHAALVDREDIALAQRIIRFRFDRKRLHSEFALHSVRSPYFQHQLNRRATGSTALGIKASKLPELRILCPPPDEQRRILEHIEMHCRPLEVSLERSTQEITLLRELRIRIIADVVTGKLDVRDVAAHLPDVEDFLDEDDDLDEDEPSLEESELDAELEEIEA